MTSPIVVFTTDFGLSDAYAGVMRGVALGINPNLRLIDLTHQILPQNVAQGSFLLGINHLFFPDDTIHVAVVDPGVGTDRRPVLLTTPCGTFVSPDNGLLSGVVDRYLEAVPESTGPVALPSELSAVHLTNPDYWRHPVSHTFHGRDIFTPVAAHLSLGVAPRDMGEPIDHLYYLPLPQPVSQGDAITGQVIYQDVYGNLVTNIPADNLPDVELVDVRIKGRSIVGLSRTFNDSRHVGEDGLIALAGSHGYLEVALPNGSAADSLAGSEGETVTVVYSSG
ncbi:MAG: SAM-dependent chlorinase/fluorinase [Dehalococcoidia bacterium]|nr:SAM-dependent chlorinase/fluorinase [Dehalococcoidia bacterium]